MILSFDVSLNATGIALYDSTTNEVIYRSTINLNASPLEVLNRLKDIATIIDNAIPAHRELDMVLECASFIQQAFNAMRFNRLTGMIMAVMYAELFEDINNIVVINSRQWQKYLPKNNEIKDTKANARSFVESRYIGLKNTVTEDEYDAIAMAMIYNDHRKEFIDGNKAKASKSSSSKGYRKFKSK